jgi:hypothetical protein
MQENMVFSYNLQENMVFSYIMQENMVFSYDLVVRMMFSCRLVENIILGGFNRTDRQIVRPVRPVRPPEKEGRSLFRTRRRGCLDSGRIFRQ